MTMDRLFKELHDDRTLVQRTGRRIVVELQRGDQALGRDIKELLWLLVRIDFICQRHTASTTCSELGWDDWDVQY